MQTQLDLDGFDVTFSCGYKCNSCLKFFQTMKECQKHQTRHAKKQRKKKSVNYVLEQFGFQEVKYYENRDMSNVSLLRWVN